MGGSICQEVEEEEDEQQSGPSGVQQWENVRVIGVERLDK